MDATRTSDGLPVYIKRVGTGDEESRIALMLSSDDLRSDPQNHCVTIVDYFQDDDDSSVSYMVMPFLRLANDPPFETVETVVDFVDQMLEVRCVTTGVICHQIKHYVGFSFHAQTSCSPSVS